MTIENKIIDIEAVDYYGEGIKKAIEETSFEVTYESGDTVIVQLTGGNFKGCLGCLVFFNDDEDYDEENEEIENMVANAIKYVENYVKNYVDETYTKKELGFNCSLNNADFYLRVNKETGEAEIVGENQYNDAYKTNLDVLAKFDSEEEAREFVDKFKTDDYNDASRLYAMLNKLMACLDCL